MGEFSALHTKNAYTLTCTHFYIYFSYTSFWVSIVIRFASNKLLAGLPLYSMVFDSTIFAVACLISSPVSPSLNYDREIEKLCFSAFSNFNCNLLFIFTSLYYFIMDRIYLTISRKFILKTWPATGSKFKVPSPMAASVIAWRAGDRSSTSNLISLSPPLPVAKIIIILSTKLVDFGYNLVDFWHI